MVASRLLVPQSLREKACGQPMLEALISGMLRIGRRTGTWVRRHGCGTRYTGVLLRWRTLLWQGEWCFLGGSGHGAFGGNGADLGDAAFEALLGFFRSIRHVVAKNDVGLEQADGGVGGIPRLHGEFHAFTIGGEFAFASVTGEERIDLEFGGVGGGQLLLRENLDKAIATLIEIDVLDFVAEDHSKLVL